ncbi:MAG TPA: PqqD family protein [Allosphingosinicella sp.]|nr:PqqD family protein [Allosphingosinicella sp.]
MDLDISYAVNRPFVVSDTIEGETVILHHGTGRYFDTAEIGTFIWRELDRGRSPRSVAVALAVSTRIDGETATDAVGTFLGELVANELVSARSAEDSFEPEPPPTAAPASFSVPTLGIHTDLADMLLLDPIHDVGPTGWPRRPETAPSASAADAA